jgi:hypothetical protein
MRRLFAEAFLVSLLDPEHPEPELRYDEERSLNVLVDGRPFIETGAAGRSDTLTEVRAEQDDYDRPEDDRGLGALETITKVKSEREDFVSSTIMFATETRRAPGERDDFARDETPSEYEDTFGVQDRGFARAEQIGGTQTFVRREREDFAVVEYWTETKTSVRPEADDFFSESDAESPSVEAARS